MAETTAQAEAAAQLGALSEQISLLQQKATRDAQRDEEMKALSDQVKTLSEKLTQGDRRRRGEFVEDDIDRLDFVERTSGIPSTIKAMHEMKTTRADIVELQAACDELFILGTLLSEDSKPKTIRETIRSTKHFETVCRRHPYLRRVKDLTTTEGADWIPTEFSAAMHEKVRLQLKVAQLFDRINMPTSTYKLPVEGSDAHAYLVAQRGAAADEVTEASKVTPSEDLTFTNRQLDAKKIGARVVVSTELTEETIVPMLPYIRDRKMVLAMAQAQEEAVLNGSAAGTLDSDSTGATDRRRAWNGLRQLAKTLGTATFAAATAGRIEVTDLRKLRQKMGKFALTPGESILVTGPLGYTQLLGLTDSNGNPLVMTRDKYGDRATLVTGEIAQIDGWPILLSEFVRDDLNHLGVYDGVTTDSTLLLLINRAQYLFGDYRAPTIKSKEIIDTDQTALVTMQRVDFMSWFPTLPTVGYVYGIRS